MRSFILLLFISIFIACGQTAQKELDTPTSGTISMSVDECFQPLAEAELDVFTAIYPKTTIIAHYQSEAEAIAHLLNDSVRLIIAARDLTAEEYAHIKDQKITAHSIKIATDGLAIIVNKANKDSVLLIKNIESILKGKASTWKDIDATNGLGDLTLVFDNKNSSTVRSLKEKFKLSAIEAKNIYALKDNPSVIDYVKNNKNAIGVIGVNWISDRDDSLSNSFLRDIAVVSLGMTEGEESFQPYQAYLADGSYPLTRNVYMISREARSGLATGFITFVAADKGQRIVQKIGLMPATVPVRFVELKSENINY